MLVIEWLFWISLIAIIYTYAGFPLLLLVRGLYRRPVRKAEVEPRVSLVIVAHNEETSIGAKLENVLELDYPRDKLEVIVASDGSDDGTDDIVAGYEHRSIRLLRFPRRGKIPALNSAVARTSNEILVFSDANSMYAPDAIRKLVQSFADPQVGAVAGNQCYTTSSGNAASFGERTYWNLDRLLKQWQSRSGSVISATGAIHAVRRELFQPVPSGVCDDAVISRRAIMQGFRLVFEPEAIACEPIASSDKAELARKTRVIVRGINGLWVVRSLFNPFRYGFYSLQLFSHKLLRWSVVWLLFVFWGASLALFNAGPIYRIAATAQSIFYGIALIGFLLRNTSLTRRKAFKLVAIPFYFCFANYAALCAWRKVLRGTKLDVWDSNRDSSVMAGATQAPE